jgi:O-antigen/teichoic acid export membrane protein
MNSLKSDSSTLQSRVLSGSFVLLAGSVLVSGINFGYNVAVARFLGPIGFGHATAVYTVLILMSAVTLSFQIVAAKVVAQQGSLEAKSAAYGGFHRSAWGAGIAIGMALILFRGMVSDYLRLPTNFLVVLLGIGVAFYVPLGSRRGYLQGTCGFRRLAVNLVLEACMRLFGSLAMIAMGFGVTGVVAANVAGVAIAYLFAVPRMPHAAPYAVHIPNAFREALQAIVFFAGQVVINNCDIVLVKHFFAPDPAGFYAVVALVGRVVFAFSWAVVNTMFPIVAGTRSEERKGHRVLGLSLLLVFACGGSLTLLLHLLPTSLWTALFGSQFSTAGPYSFSYLLTLYAATTTIYSLSVVIIAYEMSYKIANTSWAQLAFSGILIVSIYLFHSSLEQVIRVQLVLMLFLLIAVAVPFLLTAFGAEDEEVAAMAGELRRIRLVSEDEVIAEFLKTDFQCPEFADYQESMNGLVSTPNLSDPEENSLRRALFSLRHGTLWGALPKDTEWYEVDLRPSDLSRIHAFPRAQWRKLARGDFAINKVVRCIAEGHRASDPAFLAKIQSLRSACFKPDSNPGVVLLIGLNPTGPFTILDGNHRMVAAMLNSPESLRSFRFYCGLSPRMVECCWYETNLATLFRYATNLLWHMVHDPEDELARLLQSS